MAVLNESDRAAVTAQFMREMDPNDGTVAGTKAQLRQLVNETDDWIDANASAFNAALSIAIRSLFTTRQKLRVFFAVAIRRYLRS